MGNGVPNRLLEVNLNSVEKYVGSVLFVHAIGARRGLFPMVRTNTIIMFLQIFSTMMKFTVAM